MITIERQNEIAMAILLDKKRSEGVMLKPLEIKRNIKNGAKKLGLPIKDLAEFSKIMTEIIYKEALTELDALIYSDKVEG